MKILVIGSRGYIGKEMSKYITSMGDTPIECDRKEFLNGEVDGKFFECDRAVFLAWEVGGSKYLYDRSSQLDQIESNISLMSKYFPLIKRSNIPTVFISSYLAEYGKYLTYGALKRVGEAWAENLPNVSTLRLFNVYGRMEETSIRSHLVSDLIHQVVDNHAVKLLSSGKESRAFVHVKDVCTSIWRMFQFPGQIRYCPIDKWRSVYSVAHCIFTAADIEPDIQICAGVDLLPHDYPIDIPERMRLGGIATTSWVQGIEAQVREYEKHKCV